jgi:uncharacterized protein YdeI (YjbR/CyaY-like superfamily)
MDPRSREVPMGSPKSRNAKSPEPPKDPYAGAKPFATQAAWEKWLAANHAGSTGLWVKIAKGGAAPSVTYAEALEVALTYGWIDGQKQKKDERFWLQRFTPRSATSPWSKINCAKATRLIDEGRMRPAGLKAVEKAKADGRWARAYEAQSQATVPPDLRRALDAEPAALAFFESLDSHNRFAVLYRVHSAKRPETRARRIETYVAMLAKGETLHPRGARQKA